MEIKTLSVESRGLHVATTMGFYYFETLVTLLCTMFKGQCVCGLDNASVMCI
jgi:hypothetical protein